MTSVHGAVAVPYPLIRCSFCLHSAARPKDRQLRVELEMMTVINGHATCLWHAPYAYERDWLAAVARLRADHGEPAAEAH